MEDDDGVAAAVVDALRTHGHAVLRVPGVGQAREVVRDADLVLLDLGLPDGDGLGLLRDLRTRTQVPVLVMTARSAERDVVHALHLGADDYLVKPVRLRELLARIDVVTARARRAAEPAGADGPVAGGPSWSGTSSSTSPRAGSGSAAPTGRRWSSPPRSSTSWPSSPAGSGRSCRVSS